MKILFVISGLGLGGAERQVVLLSRELAREGHSISICTLTRKVPRADELAGTDVRLVIDEKRVRLDLRLLLRLRRYIREHRPDIIHGFLYDGNLYARLAAVRLGIPVLSSERNDNYRLSALQSIGYLLTARLSDGVVANSHAGGVFARRLHRVDAEDVHVVWNGIDVSELDRRRDSGYQPAADIWPGPGVKRLCIVGSIRPSKDYPLALRTFKVLVEGDPSWRMICIGDDLSVGASNHKALVLAERDKLGLASCVKFVGHRRDVHDLIASCDVLLITSLHEGFPNVVLEAMTCGTPVASTDYSDVGRILPLPWQIDASRSPAALAQIVLRCAAEHDDVACAQRRWVEAHATSAASASRMLAVYDHYRRGRESKRRSTA